MLETLLNTAHSTQMRQYIKVSMQEVLIGRSGVMDFTELAKKVMKKGLGKGSAGGVKAEGKLESLPRVRCQANEAARSNRGAERCLVRGLIRKSARCT